MDLPISISRRWAVSTYSIHRDHDELPEVDSPGHLFYTPDTGSGPRTVFLACVVHHEAWELAVYLLSEF